MPKRRTILSTALGALAAALEADGKIKMLGRVGPGYRAERILKRTIRWATEGG